MDPTGTEEARAQHAALCYRTSARDGLWVLLITSRETRRWVVPKGWPMAGKTGAETAEREAWEEAGVKGRIKDEPLGFFSYDKVLADGSAQPCVVSLYPLEVARLSDEFPERDDRRRRWFRPRKAATRVAEPELRALLEGFASANLSDPGKGKA
ncbi:MAG: NUDIX hydrolase [Defluviimonas sp.]|nr:NUDIX hydrolase [Defluviimonas sp.]